MDFIFEPEFWVAVSFFLFVGGMLYLGVHKKLAAVLDARAAAIAKELEEAKRLREEAAKVLEEYRRKPRDGVNETKEIIALASREAEILAAETRRALREQFDR